MSMLPYFFRDMMRPLRMMEKQMRMVDEMLSNPRYMNQPMLRFRYPDEQHSEVEKIIEDKDKLQVKLDVQHFAPNEISVKAAGNSIVVEGKHEEREDDKGLISRQFIRRFVLPEGHDVKNVYSSLSSDGVLTVTAPKKPESERAIPISQTGPEKQIEQKADKAMEDKKE